MTATTTLLFSCGSKNKVDSALLNQLCKNEKCFENTNSEKNNVKQSNDLSIFAAQPPDENEKVKQDKEAGFEPKDIFEIDKFFSKKYKSAIGAAMTYLISECAFKKADKDGNEVLTSDEFNDMAAKYDLSISAANPKDKSSGNIFIKNILALLSDVGDSSIGKIPGVLEVKEAFMNTLQMMLGADRNSNGKIEQDEFFTLLDEKSTESLSDEIKQKIFSQLSSSETSGEKALDIGGFTKFAFASKLAWDPNIKIKSDKVLKEFNKKEDQ